MQVALCVVLPISAKHLKCWVQGKLFFESRALIERNAYCTQSTKYFSYVYTRIWVLVNQDELFFVFHSL